MELPPDFQYSQGSLQDLEACARRFYLRHARRLSWPAADAGFAAGLSFHRLVQQILAGVPGERLAAADPALDRWHRNFQAHAPALWGGGARPPAGRFWAEVELSLPLGGRRLTARYDLALWGEDGKLRLVDWKTTRFRPARAALADRWQTRVYRYVAARAGGALTGGSAPAPEQIEVVYWFAEHPEAPERFAYDAGELERDHADLTTLAARVAGLDPTADLRTPLLAACRACPYTALCEREPAAATDEPDGEPAPTLDPDEADPPLEL